MVVRGVTVARRATTFRCDVGIRDGRIAALADLGRRRARARCVRPRPPGGIDAHVQDQPRAQLVPGGAVMADDFRHVLGGMFGDYHRSFRSRSSIAASRSDTR